MQLPIIRCVRAYLVDNDPDVRNTLGRAFREAEIVFRGFASFAEFVHAHDPSAAGCLILALQVEGADGIASLEAERAAGRCPMPVIVVIGAGDVRNAVRAMKLGARDVLERPIDTAELIQRVRASFADDAARLDASARETRHQARFDGLTDRERELVPLICSGLSNKQIAARLDLSIKTVINHRAHILNKVQAVNTADLVRMAVTSGTMLAA
jgi:FixJ family two-component response regulator